MLETGSSYWVLVDRIWESVDIHQGGDVFLRTFSVAPRSSGHLLAARWCQSEVRNGGFHQFFGNSTGVLAPEALAGFVAIGRPDLADILRAAMAYFGEPYPREQEARLTALPDGEDEAEHWDPFTAQDELFYARIKAVSFEQSADAYATRVLNTQ